MQHLPSCFSNKISFGQYNKAPRLKANLQSALLSFQLISNSDDTLDISQEGSDERNEAYTRQTSLS